MILILNLTILYYLTVVFIILNCIIIYIYFKYLWMIDNIFFIWNNVMILVPQHQLKLINIIALRMLSMTHLVGDPLQLSAYIVASPQPLYDTLPLSRNHYILGLLYICFPSRLSLIVRSTFHSLSLLFLLFYHYSRSILQFTISAAYI